LSPLHHFILKYFIQIADSISRIITGRLGYFFGYQKGKGLKMANTLKINIFLFIFVFSLTTTSAEIYKWVDENGVLHYSDTQPDGDSDWENENDESASDPIPQDSNQDSDMVNDRMSSEEITELLKQMKDDEEEIEETLSPVVELYTTSWCPYCHKAKKFFTSRGIPFIEYNVENDQDAAARMRSLTKSTSVPFVVINGRSIQGYSAAAYIRALKRN
jgi:glutaredoxin-like YruB-family protein